MTDTPTEATPASTPKIDYTQIARWGAAAAIGAAVLALELTGHADKGTFINLVAMPVLVTLGVHTAAKNLN